MAPVLQVIAESDRACSPGKAFVPGPAREKKVNVMPSASTTSSAGAQTKKARFAEPAEPSPAAETAAGRPPPPRERQRNPNLSDFDTLMEQMEKELEEARKKGREATTGGAAAGAGTKSGPAASPAPDSGSSRQSRDPNRIVVDSLDDSDNDEDDADGADPDPSGGDDSSAMDAELAQLLPGLTSGGEGGTMDYNLVKNFLDSFQSQGGFAGPAGNLAGRLGFPLPRDAPDE